MDALRRRLRTVTWFALVAMWALALAPAVSHALAPAGGEVGPWAEVCTPQGLQRVEPGDEGLVRPATEAGVIAHCAFCSLGGGDAAALPVVPLASLPDATTCAGLPGAPQACRCTLADWASPPARAPPARA